ncbi:adhesin, partial [Pseudomonas aeruginosa]
SVAHAISRGDVSGGFNSLVGGLVGHNGGELVNVDASGRVSAAASASVGGLVGSNAGSILSARSSSTVNGSGRSRIGGLVGENQIQGRIVSSMSEGTVSGDYYVSLG